MSSCCCSCCFERDGNFGACGKREVLHLNGITIMCCCKTTTDSFAVYKYKHTNEMGTYIFFIPFY